MALITNTQYKAWAQITASTWDTPITNMIAHVEAWTERYCNRTWAYSAAITEVHDGHDGPTLMLRRPPIASITSATITYPGGTTSTVTLTDLGYDTDEKGRMWWVGAGFGNLGLDEWGSPIGWGGGQRWPQGRGNISIVYAGGYAATGGGGGATVPEDLKEALYKLVAEGLKYSVPGGDGSVSGANAGQVSSQTLGNFSETYAGAASKEEVEAAFMRSRWIIDPFWRPKQ